MSDIIKYDILKKIAVIREHEGFTKELNLISWNNSTPKLDLREWMPDGRCGKGITMFEDEAELLYYALGSYFEEKSNNSNSKDEDDDNN